MNNLTLQKVKEIITDKFGKDIENNLYKDTNQIYDDYEYIYTIGDNMSISILYNCHKDEVSYIRLYRYGYCILTTYRQYKEVVESVCDLAKRLMESNLE